MIQLSGGNDGLNMVVPYNAPLYYKARPSIAIPSNIVLKVSGRQGFNPVMPELKELFDNNKVCIINNVGYAHPDRSHFRSMDIWQSASDSDQYLSAGWIGRYLGSLPPASRKPHMAIEIDNDLVLALKDDEMTGLAMQGPQRLYNSIQRGIFRPLAKIHNENAENPNLQYIYQTMEETVSSVDYINDTLKVSGEMIPCSKKGNLSGNLSFIAGMINAGLSTKVYYTSLTGFDTRINQRPRQDRLLKELSEGVGAFVKEIEDKGMADNFLIMIFSEFGRRVAQNASNDTDHGCANNVLLIGNHPEIRGVINNLPDLKDPDKNGDLKYTVDFRSVYATILNRHLDVDAIKVLGREFPDLLSESDIL